MGLSSARPPSEVVQRTPVAEVSRLKVKSWRFVPGELVVHFEGHEGECCPLCVCGRGHWFAREVKEEGRGSRLELYCHACGTRQGFEVLAPRSL